MPTGDVYAPDFPINSIWLNSKKPLSLADLKGQVVLLDFWTYCCINCIHVLADLKYLEEKYKDKPFLVVGVHSAKFFNERNIDNIQSAIDRHEISHPVVVDNDHVIWESYGVSAWPSFVLIDAAGRLRGTLAGEGRRFELDTVIGQLLEEGRKEKILAASPLTVAEKVTSPPTTLSFPGKITLDPEGRRLFIADSNHHRILLCHFHSPAEVHLVDIVGSGRRGDDDGSYPKASFSQPQGLCLVGDSLYVCDTGNHLLRRIDLREKKVKKMVGPGRLRSPWDLDYAEGYLYIAVAGSHQIWSLRLEDNRLEVFAGSGLQGLIDGNLASAQLAQPSGVSISGKTLYFVDSEASALRLIDLAEDEVRTLIGRGLFDFGYRDGSFEYALLQHPLGLAAAGEVVFVADSFNQAIRRVDLAGRQVATLIGRQSETGMCKIEDRFCEQLPLSEPNDIKVKGNLLYIADTNNHLIRVFNLGKLTLEDVRLSTVGPFGTVLSA